MTCRAKQNAIARLIFASLLGVANHLCAQGIAFSYQGRLQSGTNVANGSYDLTFSVWNSSGGPSQVGNTFTNAATSVTNGLFTVTLDCGTGIFDGNPRWLEIGVRTNGNGVFTTLSPRQPLTPVPYAIYAGGVSATGISGTIPAGNIASGTVTSNMLAPGAAAANLSANGQGAVSSGALLLAANPNATNLTAGGYTRVGGPVDLSWQQIIDALSPSARGQHTAVWTGGEMIVWGGGFNTGGRYNPTNNSWSALSQVGSPSARLYHTAEWTGSEMIVWGGLGNDVLNTGGRYNPANDSWSALPVSGLPASRYEHSAVWSGTEIIVFGGYGHNGDTIFGDTYSYAPFRVMYLYLRP